MVEVGTQRMRFGENHGARVGHESVILLRKPHEPGNEDS